MYTIGNIWTHQTQLLAFGWFYLLWFFWIKRTVFIIKGLYVHCIWYGAECRSQELISYMPITVSNYPKIISENLWNVLIRRHPVWSYWKKSILYLTRASNADEVHWNVCIKDACLSCISLSRDGHFFMKRLPSTSGDINSQHWHIE